jgi:hypothetical protein
MQSGECTILFSGMQRAEALMASRMANSSRFTLGHVTFSEIKLGLEVSRLQNRARVQIEHQSIRHSNWLEAIEDHPIFSIPPM